jgi:hypothetical protein
MAVGGGSSFFLTVGANDYLPLFESNVCAVESNCQTPIPFAGTLSNFYMRINTAPASGKGWRVTVRKNGADTTLVCDVLAGATTCSNTSSSVTFAQGDSISVGITTAPGQSTPAETSMRWTGKYAAS